LASKALASNYQGERVPLLDVVVAEALAVFEKAAETPQFLRLSGNLRQVLDVVLDVVDQLAKLDVDVKRWGVRRVKRRMRTARGW